MRTKRAALWVFSAFAGAVLFSAFSKDNSFLTITKKDVKLTIPKDFPKPVYDFGNNHPTPEIFTLGRKLFYDPILSRDSSTSCASCHMRIAAFAHIDHALSHGINGLIGKRNVPPIQNMIWQRSFMWDGAVNHLESQPLAPISNPIEMDEDIAHIIVKLSRNKAYSLLFKAAYKDTLVSTERILKAHAQFTGLMISCNSKYDKYRQGLDSLTAPEKKGMELFRSYCSSCHKEPLFTDNEFRNNGLAPDSALGDEGRKNITGLATDYMKFRVPSLRNVEMTYPYMHDGRFRDLKQVIAYYTSNKFSAGADPLMKDASGLGDEEKAALIAFLKTLTDKTFLYDRRFADPNYK
jgi:cytochrome c peroxidase